MPKPLEVYTTGTKALQQPQKRLMVDHELAFIVCLIKLLFNELMTREYAY